MSHPPQIPSLQFFDDPSLDASPLACTAPTLCNWDTSLSVTQCTGGIRSAYTCATCLGEVCREVSSDAMCFSPFLTGDTPIETSCAAQNGTYVDDPLIQCVLPISDRSSCLDPAYCSPYGGDICLPYCHFPQFNQTTCGCASLGNYSWCAVCVVCVCVSVCVDLCACVICDVSSLSVSSCVLCVC